MAAKPDMKRRLSNQRTGGLTLVEVLVSIVVVALLAAVFIPAFTKARPRAARSNCVSNLKQVALAFRMWSNDHGETFPWSVSTTNGGTLEFAGRPEVFRHYLAISNELLSPRVLKCEGDEKRTKASLWDQLTNDAQHISYFVGLDANETKPQSILSGDRNLTTNGTSARGAVSITRSMIVGWSRELHGGFGNLALGDGSAYQSSSAAAQNQFGHSWTNFGASSLRLVIP